MLETNLELILCLHHVDDLAGLLVKGIGDVHCADIRHYMVPTLTQDVQHHLDRELATKYGIRRAHERDSRDRVPSNYGYKLTLDDLI